MEQTKQLTVQQFFKQPNVSAKFNELLKENAPQFIANVLQIASSEQLSRCTPQSIFNAAITAAVLKLSINPSLGQAHIVPYSGVAQLQIGYLGFIQLAMRTGQYKKLNVIEVYKNQFISYDRMSEELIGDFKKEGSGEIIGYACAFMLMNGFQKVVYWDNKKMISHFERFSKMYQKDKFKTFGLLPMALKTVLKNTLKKWGVLSIELQTALVSDQTEILNPDKNEVNYLDNPQRDAKVLEEKKKTFEDLKELIEGAHHVFTVKEQNEMLYIYEKSTEDTLEFDFKHVESIINNREEVLLNEEAENLKNKQHHA